MSDSNSNGHHKICYSEKDNKLYWVNADTNAVEKSWECSGVEGKSKNEGKDEPLPVGEYTLGNGKLSPKGLSTRLADQELGALEEMGGMGPIASEALKLTKEIIQSQASDVNFKMDEKDREELNRLTVADGGDTPFYVQNSLDLGQKNVQEPQQDNTKDSQSNAQCVSNWLQFADDQQKYFDDYMTQTRETENVQSSGIDR